MSGGGSVIRLTGCRGGREHCQRIVHPGRVPGRGEEVGHGRLRRSLPAAYLSLDQGNLTTVRDHDLPALERRSRGKSRFDDDESAVSEARAAHRAARTTPTPSLTRTPASAGRPGTSPPTDPSGSRLAGDLAVGLDTPLGVIKTGKEADVDLLCRSLPGAARPACWR